MALAPIFCEKCNHRISPSERISVALDNSKEVIIGECCALKQEQTLVKSASTSILNQFGVDYDVFIKNGFVPYHLDAFNRVVEHVAIIGKPYVICLNKINSLSSRVKYSKIYTDIWVVFMADGEWELYGKGPFAHYPDHCNSEFRIRKASRYMSAEELDTYIKKELS